MIKKILVSQPKPSSDKSPYYDIMRKHGVEIVFHPFIKVQGLTPREFRDQHIDISQHTAVIFTSRHAIDHFFQLCQQMRVDIPDDMKYFCITETISLYIQKYVQYRKRKVFFGETGKNTSFAQLLKQKNINFTEGIMYRTVSNEIPKDEPFDYDMLVFFSPSGIQSLLKNFPDYQQGDTRIASFGPGTARSICDAGLRLDLQAPTPQYPSITAALDAYIKEQNNAQG